jgi:gliding motility-associated-like protein
VQQSVGFVVAPLSPAALCPGQCMPLTASVTGGVPNFTYNWTTNSSPVSSPVCPAQSTTYTLSVSDATGCTSAPQTMLVSVSPALHLNATPPVSYCSGGSAALQVTATGGTGNITYTWSPAAGLSSTSIANPMGNGQTSTTYTVVVNDACGIKSDTALVSVTVNPSPQVTLQASDTLGCVPLCVNFAVSSTTVCSGIVWHFGDGDSATGCASQKHCYESAGVFTVNMNVTDVHNCKAVVNHINYIHTLPTPEAAFSYSPYPVMMLNPEVTFSSVLNGTAGITWDFGDSRSSGSHVQNPKYTYQDTGCYEVSLILENTAGCLDTARTKICIKSGFSFYAPTAFTPNGDGLNDIWMPVGSGISARNYEILIFDRWGNRIFETHTLGEGWNGHANNGPEVAQIDTYIWKVTLKDVEGLKHAFSGVCNLIR